MRGSGVRILFAAPKKSIACDPLRLVPNTHVGTFVPIRGLSIINILRARAAASTTKLNTNPNAAAVFLYSVNPYPAFPDQVTARKALRRERRLEMGLEGFRFFDLVRWGVAKSTLA